MGGDFSKDFNNDFSNKGVMENNDLKRWVEETLPRRGDSFLLGSLLKKAFLKVIDKITDSENRLGDLADLKTDHKSDAVDAINELFDVLETSELVISMAQSTADRAVIYNMIVAHPQLAKEIVFYNQPDNLYYRVNGYNIIDDVLHLHVIMKDGSLMDKVIQVGSNGSISIV